ncbi:SWIM zinc finger family protein [Acinetobacter nectaris]|nr:SWIM zinc finger family protein [Acinetobacter nectaris]
MMQLWFYPIFSLRNVYLLQFCALRHVCSCRMYDVFRFWCEHISLLHLC